MTLVSNLRISVMLILSIFITALLASPASGRARTFMDGGVDYVIEFPSAKWRAHKPSGIIPARTRMEFTYADANSIRLLVRRKTVDSSMSPADMVRRRQIRDQHVPGYVLVKEENIAGRLSGAKFSYEYSQGGERMLALIYYLEADNRTIYSLNFTGTADELLSLRDQIDSIARSFRLKQSKRVHVTRPTK